MCLFVGDGNGKGNGSGDGSRLLWQLLELKINERLDVALTNLDDELDDE